MSAGAPRAPRAARPQPGRPARDGTAMQRRTLGGGKLRAATYDERLARLVIEFADGSVRVFKGVPAEVWQRLLRSPNPGSYFDDRIADEYPSERGSPAADAQAKSRLDDLFGPPGTD